MRFGVFDHVDRATSDPAGQFRDRLRMVEAYEQAGFYAYHVAEHHATPLGLSPSPMVYLSAVAQRTSTLRLGPLVLPLPLYHPLRVFEEACMLDHLSNGRLELGVGKGISPHELAAFQLDPELAQERFHESLDVLCKAFSSDTLMHEGEHYRLRDVPVPVHSYQRPHPPLWYGVVKPSSAQWAAQKGMNIVCGAGAASGVRAAVEAYRASRAGDQPALVGMTRQLLLAPTDEEAMQVARRAFGQFHRSFVYLWEYYQDPLGKQILPEDLDAVISGGEAVIGSPATVAARLAQDIEEAGINYLVCRFAFGDQSLQEVLRSLHLFRDEVMPVLTRSGC